DSFFSSLEPRKLGDSFFANENKIQLCHTVYWQRKRRQRTMADRFVLSHLKRFPLFERLTPQQLEAVANAVQVLRYQPGEVIFTQGQPAAGAVIFASGRGELTQVGADRV